MTLDAIIDKYGTHELDIDLVKQYNNQTIVYAYCHQHNTNNQFMVNYYLEIVGNFHILEKQLENENDICFHIAIIEKNKDGNYEISGCGGWLLFSVDDNLQVSELDEKTYYEHKKTMTTKNKTSKLIPFSIHNGNIYDIKWLDSKLYLSINVDKNSSNPQQLSLNNLPNIFLRRLQA